MNARLRTLSPPAVFVTCLLAASCSSPPDEGAIVSSPLAPDGKCIPGLEGTWDAPIETPGVLGIHSTLLRSGSVLFFGGDPSLDGTGLSGSTSRVFDPSTGALRTPAFPNGAAATVEPNLFCAGQTVLGDGRVLVVGGSGNELKAAHVFDPATEAFTANEPMAMGRWYPTVAALPQNKAFVISGTTDGPVTPVNETYQIFDGQKLGLQKELPKPFTPESPTVSTYPFVHLLPSGLLAVHSNRSTRLFDPRVEEWLPKAYPTISEYSRTYPAQGALVLLPLEPDSDDAAELMVIGGAGKYGFVETGGIDPQAFGVAAQKTVESINLRSATMANAKWEPRGAMKVGRVMPDAVVLPTGNVLVVGGSSSGFAAGHADKPVLAPEIYDRQKDAWQSLCPTTDKLARLYHATAILLPDARVLVAGHNAGNNPGDYKENRTRVQIYNPPYLAKGPRPLLIEGPSSIGYGQTFDIAVNGDVASAILIRPGSATHSNDMSQRAVKLAITRGPDPAFLTLKAPPTSNIAPEGPYMLFLVSAAGVPSVAKFVDLQ